MGIGPTGFLIWVLHLAFDSTVLVVWWLQSELSKFQLGGLLKAGVHSWLHKGRSKYIKSHP